MFDELHCKPELALACAKEAFPKGKDRFPILLLLVSGRVPTTSELLEMICFLELVGLVGVV